MIRQPCSRYDVVVVGGGPAGAAAALVLADRGVRVLMVTAPPRLPPVGEAIPPASRPILRDLGVWAEFRSGEHLPCPGTSAAWGSADLHGVDYVFDPHGNGWHLDRPRFDAMLRHRAARAGAVIRHATVTGVARTGEGWRLRVSDRPGSLESTWLVDATGRRTLVARRCAARHRQDRLVAAYLRLEPDRSDRDARTLIEAGPAGWWYTALLPGGERVVAHFTDVDLVRAALRTTGGFMSAARDTRHVRRHVHSGRCAGTPIWLPAHGMLLDPPAGAGWIAVGDAVLAVDPLSAQGVLNALHTGVRAGLAVAAHREGDPGALDRYRDFVHRLAAAYRRRHLDSYRQERRWADRPFWQRRLDG